MPYNGVGTFVALPPPDYPAVPGDLVKASQHNNNMVDLFGGLSNAVTRDGQSPPTANLPMAGKRFTDVGDAVLSQEYLTKRQMGSNTAGEGAALLGMEGGGTAQRRLDGLPQDVRRWCTADGVADDFVGLQAAIVACEVNGWSLWWPDGVYTRILFTSSNSTIFIHGRLNLLGANRQNCGIKIAKNYDSTGHNSLFAFGIPSKGAAVDAWTGEMSGLGFVLEAGVGKFERCCHFYEWQYATVRDCWYDGRATTFTLAQQSGGFLGSNVQPTWATGQTNAYGITVIGNEGHASCYYQNAESIGLTNLYDSVIAFNKMYGFADDIALHGGANVTIAYNTNKPVLGRFYVEDATQVLLQGNHLERCKDPSGIYTVNTGATGIRLSHSATYAVANSAPANTNISVINNRVVMPEGSYMVAAIYAENCQDGLIIQGNTLESQGATGTADASTTAISVVNTATLGAWVGPTGNPDAATGGVVRIRNVVISGNQCLGTGWSSTEGSISISMATSSSAALGPFEIRGNLAGGYFVPYAACNYYADNRALAVSTDPFKNVSLIALYRTTGAVFRSVMTAAQNLNFAGHPIGAPADLLDDGGLDFFAASAGSIRGLRVRVAAAAIGANLCLIRILKNGAQLGADTAFSTITPTTNFVSYSVNFTGATMTFAAQDKLKVQLYFTAGQTVALTGTAEMFVLYNGA